MIGPLGAWRDLELEVERGQQGQDAVHSGGRVPAFNMRHGGLPHARSCAEFSLIKALLLAGAADCIADLLRGTGKDHSQIMRQIAYFVNMRQIEYCHFMRYIEYLLFIRFSA